MTGWRSVFYLQRPVLRPNGIMETSRAAEPTPRAKTALGMAGSEDIFPLAARFNEECGGDVACYVSTLRDVIVLSALPSEIQEQRPSREFRESTRTKALLLHSFIRIDS